MAGVLLLHAETVVPYGEYTQAWVSLQAQGATCHNAHLQLGCPEAGLLPMLVIEASEYINLPHV